MSFLVKRKNTQPENNDNSLFMAVRQKLDYLFNKRSSFSICCVDEIGNALGVQPKNSPHYKVLNLLHCVDYSKIEPELKARLPIMVMEALRPDITVNAHEMALLIMREGNDFIQAEDY